MKWMITVPKKVADMIVSGKQKVYFTPKMNDLVYRGDVIFMNEEDSGGKVVGVFIVADRICNSPNGFWDIYGNLTGWSKKEFFEFCKEVRLIYGVRIKDAAPADKSYTIRDFGLSQPPSEMVYLS